MNSKVTLPGQVNGINFAQGRHEFLSPASFLDRDKLFFSAQFVILLSNLQKVSDFLLIE